MGPQERLDRKTAEMEGKLDFQETIASKLAGIDKRVDAMEVKEQKQGIEKDLSPEISGSLHQTSKVVR